MIAFDTDVLSDLLRGRPDYVARAAAVPAVGQGIPVVAVAELFRGHLNAIRQAEAGKTRIPLTVAYQFFEAAVLALRSLPVLPYTDAADAQVQAWKRQKLKVGTQDLRIAAVAIVHGATLVTRNRRDYDQVPGLALDVW